jgi:hypothetical protein
MNQATNIAEEKDMSMDLNGLASLVDTVRAGGRGNFLGGGGEGGLNGCFAPWASPGTIRADVLANRDIGNTGIENLQREFSNTTTRDQMTVGFNRICDTNANNFQLVTAQNHALEVKLCSIEKDQVASEGRLLAKMEALSKEGIIRDLDRAERKVERLEMQNACGCGCGGHHGHHGGRG